jgi:hypothetical protein
MHLRSADVRRDAAIPILETNAETADTGNIHPHSEK